jgi:hypothetical protein
MKSILTILSLLTLITFVGCRTEAVYHSQGVPVPAGLTSTQVKDAILGTIEARNGWFLDSVGSDKVTALLAVRLHKATVDIFYDTKTVRPVLVSSENLKQEDGQIHKNFNTWVQLLERDILIQLKAVAAK